MSASSDLSYLDRLSSSSSSLPDDIAFEAQRRLRWAAAIYASTFVLAWGIPRVAFGDESWDAGRAVSDTVSILAILLGYGLAIWLRRGRASIVRHFVVLGLGFEVVSSFAIAVSEFWAYFSPAHLALVPNPHIHGISWVCSWIVVYPMLVPASLKRILPATLLAASSTPIILFLSLTYWSPDSNLELAGIFIPVIMANGICTMLAIASASAVHGLTRKVREARRIGSYHLVELIGKGGMGEVWKANHQLLARPAAVKLVRPDALQAGDPVKAHRLLRRFEREAQATAQLRCPHSIGLYDFGIREDATFYYVMELLEGLSLESLVERFGPQPAERVVYLMAQVCESLEEAHQRGLIHRDIKPANIFCCRYGLAVDFVKVLDFGLVKGHEDLQAGGTKLTVEGSATGTPAYMAPEAIAGDAPLDLRGDIYGLGCVMYWLLTARLVFEAKTPMRMALKHIDEAPSPPSAVTELEIPEGLDQLVLDCLKKSPAERPQTMSEVAERLGQIALDSAWTQERALRWWSRHQPEESETGSFVSRGSTPIVSG